MSSSGITQAPNAPRVLRATILMVALHSLLWAAVLFGLFALVPDAERVFRDFNMKLPALTQLMMALARWVEYHAPFVGIFVFFLLIVDGMGYYRLRTSAPRFISKLWAVCMFLLPVLVIMGLIIGILKPLIALQEGLSK
jgi:type II secretory pathway component PulF